MEIDELGRDEVLITSRMCLGFSQISPEWIWVCIITTESNSSPSIWNDYQYDIFHIFLQTTTRVNISISIPRRFRFRVAISRHRLSMMFSFYNVYIIPGILAPVIVLFFGPRDFIIT